MATGLNNAALKIDESLSEMSHDSFDGHILSLVTLIHVTNSNMLNSILITGMKQKVMNEFLFFQTSSFFSEKL